MNRPELRPADRLITLTESGLEAWLQSVWRHYTGRNDLAGLMLHLTSLQQLIQSSGQGCGHWAWQLLEGLIKLLAVRFSNDVRATARRHAERVRTNHAEAAGLLPFPKRLQ